MAFSLSSAAGTVADSTALVQAENNTSDNTDVVTVSHQIEGLREIWLPKNPAILKVAFYFDTCTVVYQPAPMGTEGKPITSQKELLDYGLSKFWPTSCVQRITVMRC